MKTATSIADERDLMEQGLRMLVEEDRKAIRALPIDISALGRDFLAGTQPQCPRLVIDRLVVSRAREPRDARERRAVVHAPLDRPRAQQAAQDCGGAEWRVGAAARHSYSGYPSASSCARLASWRRMSPRSTTQTRCCSVPAGNPHFWQ